MIKRIALIIFVLIIGVVIYYVWINFLAGDNVKLYFATKDGMYLDVEYRKIVGDKVEGTLKALITGPESSNLSQTIPPGVEVLSIKIRDGLAVVNFNEKIVTNHWGGSTGEILTIYSIVNTICQFPQINRVQILVEGQKLETLAGHIILDESLEVNKDLIKK